jgi:hypothetical protein|tara:strand:- start:63 stop:638 length:576 start_codon:yes stop_codon:yes gene_type:complete
MSKKFEKVIVKEGDQFNDWTITKQGQTNKTSEKGILISYVEVRCKCGFVRTSRKYQIVRGVVTKCRACKRKEGFNNGHFAGYEELGGYYVGQLRDNAKRRNLPFETTAKELWKLLVAQDFKCALSGMYIRTSRTIDYKTKMQTASVDRIDSTKGYVEGNIQWVHKVINQMKSNRTDKELIEFCKAVALYNQ